MTYRVVRAYVEDETTKERKGVYEDVEAGDMQIEYGCLIFKDSVGSLRIIKAFKSWEDVTKTSNGR